MAVLKRGEERGNQFKGRGAGGAGVVVVEVVIYASPLLVQFFNPFQNAFNSD